MKLLPSVVATIALLGGVGVGFALAVPGCCTCTEDSVEEFELGEYEVVAVSTEQPQGPVIDGAYTVTFDSVVVQYESASGTAWTVTYDVVCGNFEIAACE